MASRDEELLEAELKGKTLIVYLYLLRSRKNTVGVREVQRALGFSSPSVAAYHLNKLRELGLVESIRGDYRLTRLVKVGVLRRFIAIRGLLLPRLLFYAVLVTSMLITYLAQYPQLTRRNVAAIVLGLVPAIILWYETLKTWREKP